MLKRLNFATVSHSKMYFTPLMVLFVILCLYPPGAKSLNFTFHPNFVPGLLEGEKENVTLIFNETVFTNDDCAKWFSVVSEPSYIAGAELDCLSTTCEELDQSCNVTLVLEGRFLGLAVAHVLYKRDQEPKARRIGSYLNIQVIKIQSALSKAFIGLVAVMVTINYINMGCVLDLEVVKSVLKRPIGPVIGFVCQFVLMPLVAYGVGLWLFIDKPILRLGLFTFGCSPGGGASNMWTVLLQGNLNLSITMTFLSTIVALGSIPLWLFTLGKDIVKGTTIRIPFDNILLSLAGMVIALGAGLLIQKYLPRVAAFGKRMLSPACIVMIIFLVVLGSIANFYMLLMLTWTMIFASTLSVWLGFLAGCVVSIIFRLPKEDVVAVSVETGIQNTGIAFLLLSYSLKSPFSEISSVVPIAASIMTPFPMLAVICIRKLRPYLCRNRKENLASLSEKDYQSNNVNGIDNRAMENESLNSKFSVE